MPFPIRAIELYEGAARASGRGAPPPYVVGGTSATSAKTSANYYKDLQGNLRFSANFRRNLRL
jgi:hypothetical protein